MRPYDDLWTKYGAGSIPLADVVPKATEMTRLEITDALAASGFAQTLTYPILSVLGQAVNPAVLGLRTQVQSIGPWVGVSMGPNIVLAFQNEGDLIFFRMLIET